MLHKINKCIFNTFQLQFSSSEDTAKTFRYGKRNLKLAEFGFVWVFFLLYLVLVRCFKGFIQFFTVLLLHFTHAAPASQSIYFDFSGVLVSKQFSAYNLKIWYNL